MTQRSHARWRHIIVLIGVCVRRATDLQGPAVSSVRAWRGRLPPGRVQRTKGSSSHRGDAAPRERRYVDGLADLATRERDDGGARERAAHHDDVVALLG